MINLEEAAKRERANYDELERLLSAVAEHVARSGLDVIGDGHCGYVLQRFEVTLWAHGLETRAPRTPRPGPKRSLSPSDKLRILRRDEFTCRGCGEAGTDLHVDHIIPVSKGGTDDDENLQALCVDCNQEKGDAMPEGGARV